MKSIVKQLNKRKHVVFLDLEGTQFSHEMIALGAVRVDLDHNYQIKKVYKGLKLYVKSVAPIGRFVQELTGITPEILKRKGVPYREAIDQFKKYCGLSFNKMAFFTFGTHDLRILNKSLLASPDANKETVVTICRNCIDLCGTLSQYIKDENGNPLSQTRYLELFNETPIGEAHDPLFDAKNLMLLYKAAMKDDDIIFTSYLQVLTKMKHLPDPVHRAIVKLINGQDMTSQEFLKYIEDYIK